MKRKQRDRVLEYMMKYGSITPAEAFMELSVSRLSARIYELKHKDGYHIEKDDMTFKNRFGETCTYAKYRLVIESA